MIMLVVVSMILYWFTYRLKNELEEESKNLSALPLSTLCCQGIEISSWAFRFYLPIITRKICYLKCHYISYSTFFYN